MTMPPPEVALIIRFNPATGHVNIEGPLDQRMLCYGLLEMAREILSKGAANPKPSSPIHIPELRFRGPLK